MGRFAAQTTVPVERSRAEIEETLRRYNATEFHSGWRAESAMIAFRLENLFIRFVLPLPSRTEKRFTHKRDRFGREQRRTNQMTSREYDQEVRQRWRALLLTIKAKLEAVECQISTLEREFLAFIVLPNEMTIGDWLSYEVLPAIKEGKMPLLGFKAQNEEDITDVEFEEKDGAPSSLSD